MSYYILLYVQYIFKLSKIKQIGSIVNNFKTDYSFNLLIINIK